MKVKVTIKHKKLLRPIDHIGDLFYNKDGVFSVLHHLEDIMKSQQYFGTLPVDIYFMKNGMVVATTDTNMKNFPVVKVDDLLPILTELHDAAEKEVFVNIQLITTAKVTPLILRDKFDNIIVDKSLVFVDNGKTPVEVFERFGELYFSPYGGKPELVHNYFKNDLELLQDDKH